MSALALLAEAMAADLTLRAEAGRLHWRANARPAPDLLAELRRHKPDLLEFLTEIDERAGILEFDGGLPREQAEAQAVAEVLARVGVKCRHHSYFLQRRLPMNADLLLQHAAAVVWDRRRLYGEPIDLFEQVATRWSLGIGAKVTPAQAMLCLIDLKVARLANDPRHLDSIMDIAGYAGCLAEALSDA